MFFDIWNMILDFWVTIMDVAYFGGNVTLGDIVLWMFSLILFFKFFVVPIMGGKSI